MSLLSLSSHRFRWLATFLALAAFSLALPATGRSEAKEIRISRGFGTVYLALMVMEQHHLMEKHAKEAGLGDVKATYLVFDGGGNINDAMITGALDIGTAAVPSFMTIWDKSKGQVMGLSALSSCAMYLMSANPNVKTLRDITDKDKIAVPVVKTSLPGGIIQMLAAKEFGKENFAKLDSMTVSLPYPEALAVMLGGGTEINHHLCSPPFCYLEMDSPKLHRVVSAYDELGDFTMMMTFTTKKFHDANPKLSAAFVSALDEANKMIEKDHALAAAAYTAISKVKASDKDILRVLDDPQNTFSIVPKNITRWSDFMHMVGRIKTKPASWKDLFFPELASQPGS